MRLDQSLHLERYVEWGFRGIVMLEERSSEDSSGRNDYFYETLVCLDPLGKPTRLTVNWTHSVFSKPSYSIARREQITQEEYERIVAEQPIVDSPEWYAEREREQQARVAADEVRKKLIPKCPACGTQMTVRRNGKTGSRFFGCGQFPNCRATLPGNPALFHYLEKLP